MWNDRSLWTSSLEHGRLGQEAFLISHCPGDLSPREQGQVCETLGRGEMGVDGGSVGLYVEGWLTSSCCCFFKPLWGLNVPFAKVS